MSSASPIDLKALAIGVFAAGFGPLVGGSAFYLASGEAGAIFPEALLFALIAFPFAAVFALIFGLPIFFAAQRRRIANWWTAASYGLLVGCGVQFLVLGTNHVENLLLYGSEGMASGILFYLGWRLSARA